MELKHLIDLICELQEGSRLSYVREPKMKCTFVRFDHENNRVLTKTPNGKDFPFAETFLSELASKIKPNEAFSLSQILNNKGSNRAVIDSIIANTSEFYWFKNGNSTYTVWVPSKKHTPGKLVELADTNTVTFSNSSSSVAATLSTILYDDANKHLYNDEYLATSLKKMYEEEKDEDTKDTYLLLFGLKYGRSISNASKICKLADVPLTKPISEGVKLYGLIKENKFGVGFYDDNCLIKKNASTDDSSSACVSGLKAYFEDFITVLHTKPFLILSGISGTGKSRKVQELAYATCPRDGELDKDPTTPGNYCLIEVKPNWHDSTELLGYYSTISGKYMFTDFVRFVYKATKYPDVPFFVCLDEMNLAPVEQYFAEYLSVLETRKKVVDGKEYGVKDGSIVSAELITKESFKDLSEYSIEYEPQKNIGSDDGVRVPIKKQLYKGEDINVFRYIQEYGLRLPQNLFVIGTVNMDDTTHQFSRKVIDRAFTIEMNGGDFNSIFNKRDTLTYVDDYLSGDVIIPSYAKAQDVLADLNENDVKAIEEEVPQLLDDINADDIFGGTPFRVSFRVENELILYFGSLRMMDAKAAATDLIHQAFLAVLLEKVLPRVEGDDKAMHCDDQGSSAILTNLQSNIDKYKPADYKDGDGSLYDTLTHKLTEMNQRVKDSYFTSFFS